MKLYVHWLEMTGLISTDDIATITDSLNIPESLLKTFITTKGTTVCTFETGEESESVRINIPEEGYGRVTLRGGFFDAFPAQSIRDFKDFMYSRKGNCLRLDVSFKDTSGYLNFEDYFRMSRLDNYLDYLVGSTVVCRKRKIREVPDSNNRQGVPDLHANHRLIHYGDANAKQFAKFYQCPDGINKFEITLKDKAQAKVLLNAYDISNMNAFNELAKGALVKAINFITPVSKRGKRPVQIESYRKFLGSEVKPIKWTEHCPEKQRLNKLESLLKFREKIFKQLWSCIPMFDIPEHDIEALLLEVKMRLVSQEAVV